MQRQDDAEDETDSDAPGFRVRETPPATPLKKTGVFGNGTGRFLPVWLSKADLAALPPAAAPPSVESQSHSPPPPQPPHRQQQRHKQQQSRRKRLRRTAEEEEEESDLGGGGEMTNSDFFSFLEGWKPPTPLHPPPQPAPAVSTTPAAAPKPVLLQPAVAMVVISDTEEDDDEDDALRPIDLTRTKSVAVVDRRAGALDDLRKHRTVSAPPPEDETSAKRRRRLLRTSELTGDCESACGDDEQETNSAAATPAVVVADDGDSTDDEERKSLDAVLELCESCSKRLCEFLKGVKQEPSAAAAAAASETHGRESQPRAMQGRLRGYQLAGMNWLYMLHRFGFNGILCDEMGLGKTVQAISLLALLQEKGYGGPHLIVVPATLLDNWSRELDLWCPSLSVLVYYGSLREREEIRIRTPPEQLQHGEAEETAYDVVLTTYTIASSRFDRSYLRKCRFGYFIVDEAHSVKNSASRRFEKLLGMPSEFRLLLTGTPLQNNLKELWALLRFMMPAVIDSSPSSPLHKQVFDGDQDQCITRIKGILAPFLLRRLKTQVAGDVARKRHVVVECEMGPTQSRLYTQLVDSSKSQWNRSAAGASAGGNTQTSPIDLSDEDEEGGISADKSATARASSSRPASLLNNIVMQLRKMANHPLLCRAFYTDAVIAEIARTIVDHASKPDADQRFAGATVDDLFAEFVRWSDFDLHSLCCRNEFLHEHRLAEESLMASTKLAKLFEMLEKLADRKVLVFSQMTRVLDIIEVAATLRGICYLRLDGSTPVGERQKLVDRFNKDERVFVFLLSTKAAGLGINLTAADTVIFFDISFNPQVERQAEDRCHRLGQNKEVTVYRLIASGTIDNHMLMLEQQKQRLHDRVLDEGEWSEAATAAASAEGESESQPASKHWMSKMVSEIFGLLSPLKLKK